MPQRKATEFKRGIKALATQAGWLVEIVDRKGPTEAIVIFKRVDGDVQRIATIVLREDSKEIEPFVARAIIRKLKVRSARELAGSAQEPIRREVEVLVRWMQTWFSAPGQTDPSPKSPGRL